MKRTVYLDSTIISYLAARPTRDFFLAAHQGITWDWWEKRRHNFDLYVSQPVINECQDGDPDAAARRLALLNGLTILDVDVAAATLAGELIRKRLLPPNSTADALHVAVASVRGINYLLTWNCRHLANAEVLQRLYDTVRANGFTPPIICTPEVLMGEEL